MILTSDLQPKNGFTQVLNDTIFDDRLSHAEFRIWCQLLALRKGQKSIAVDAEEIAALLGIKPDVCRHHRRSLKAKGFLRVKGDTMVVTVPDEDFVPAQDKLSPEQQLRHDLKEAWNSSKPEPYTTMRHPLSQKQVDTLLKHADHNKRENLTQFIRDVLKGCVADPWWSDKKLTFDNIFGTGTPKQNKFTNVEKLFKLANSKEGKAAVWDVNSDKDWLEWYHSKDLQMTKVVRLEMDRFDAWDHQVENDGDDTLYIYTDKRGVVVHWTYKELHNLGVGYLPTAK